jgi:hypothetical protein
MTWAKRGSNQDKIMAGYQEKYTGEIVNQIPQVIQRSAASRAPIAEVCSLGKKADRIR